MRKIFVWTHSATYQSETKCRMVQYRPNETKMKSVAHLRAEVWQVLWNIFVSTLWGTRQHSVLHFPPPYQSLTLVNMWSRSARRSQHRCMQKYRVSQTIWPLCVVWGLRRMRMIGLLFRRRSQPLLLLPRSLRKPWCRNGRNECWNS